MKLSNLTAYDIFHLHKEEGFFFFFFFFGGGNLYVHYLLFMTFKIDKSLANATVLNQMLTIVKEIIKSNWEKKMLIQICFSIMESRLYQPIRKPR